MGARTAVVHRSFDPVQAELLGGVLRDVGLDARVVGTRSGAAIGVGQVILHLHIEVPLAEAEQARELLAAYLAGDGVDLLRAEGELAADEDDEPAPRETPRRGFMAVGLALVMPFGAAHLYARRSWTALALLIGHGVAFGLMSGAGWRDLVGGGAMHGLLVVADGALAVAAIRSGRRWGPAGQIAIGSLLIALAGLGGGAVARAIPEPLFDPALYWAVDPRGNPDLEAADRVVDPFGILAPADPLEPLPLDHPRQTR